MPRQNDLSADFPQDTYERSDQFYWNVAKTALQFVDELRLKVPVNEPVETVICTSLAARDVPVSCCCNE